MAASFPVTYSPHRAWEIVKGLCEHELLGALARGRIHCPDSHKLGERFKFNIMGDGKVCGEVQIETNREGVLPSIVSAVFHDPGRCWPWTLVREKLELEDWTSRYGRKHGSHVHFEEELVLILEPVATWALIEHFFETKLMLGRLGEAPEEGTEHPWARPFSIVAGSEPAWLVAHLLSGERTLLTYLWDAESGGDEVHTGPIDDTNEEPQRETKSLLPSPGTAAIRDLLKAELSRLRCIEPKTGLERIANQQAKVSVLAKKLVSGFSIAEYEELFYELGFELENVVSPLLDKPTQIRKSIQYLEREGKIPDFLRLCQARRPDVHWVID